VKNCYVAVDLGASSGRVVLGTLDGDVMQMDELHPLPTPMIERDGHLYWDVAAMWEEIQAGITKAFADGCEVRSVSVDSWAVDYVPLDEHGVALRNPYSYRDSRTAGRMEIAVEKAGGADALYGRTGIQFLPFNTLPQILSDIADEPELVSRTASRLLIAEYFLYMMSGKQVLEATNASTTQLVDAITGSFIEELVNAIGDDISRYPTIVYSGTPLGALTAAVPEGSDAPLVITTCAHDTAAAVAAVPASSNHTWAYISSGTWSLVGAELTTPVLTRAAREAGFTNEAGLDGTVRFLKNRAGMWVLEELRREWQEKGTTYTHEALFRSASNAEAPGFTIDLNAAQFSGRGEMMRKVRDASIARGFSMPSSHAGITRLVLESIAESHAEALRQLDAVTGLWSEDVHIVGGGALNDMLNQLTADRSGRRVLAGPEEATVLGNLLVQARALGHLPDGETIRSVSRRSSRVREFTPRRTSAHSALTSFAR
jgi:Sugar (pentulose and hexulose) kinases